MSRLLSSHTFDFTKAEKNQFEEIRKAFWKADQLKKLKESEKKEERKKKEKKKKKQQKELPPEVFQQRIYREFDPPANG